jgi:hypothetical protein
MTVQHDSGTSDQTSSRPNGGDADAPTTGLSGAASTATDAAREIVTETGAQARTVAGEAKQQVERLVREGREEVNEQAKQRSTQAAGQLRSLSEQLGALAEGRPEAAGAVVSYVNDVQQQLGRVASHLEQRGPQGIVDDVTRFARRRPGVFLAGAVGVGFVVGRLVRAGAATQNEDQSSLPASAQGSW